MSELQCVARLKIHDGKLDEFKRLAAKCAELVRTNPSFATGAVGGPRRPINTRLGLEGLHYGAMEAKVRFGGWR